MLASIFVKESNLNCGEQVLNMATATATPTPTPTPNTFPEGTVIDPNLIDYLSHIIGHNRKYIQFSFRKIEDIIINELEIDLQNSSEITRRVTIQCFAYFLKNWPQWTQYTRNELQLADAYESLKKYMKNKLMQLKLKEKAFSIDSKSNMTELPNYDFPELTDDMNMELPYSITIAAPAVKLPDIAFSQTKDGDMEIKFESHTNPVSKFTTKNLLEYPFVSISFHIPGIIKMERATCTKFERSIQRSDISPDTSSKYETTAENVSSEGKVYTFNFFRKFFRELCCLFDKLGPRVSLDLRSEMYAFSSSVLTDIFDSDVCNKTVCEGAIITYNIGKSRYYCDTSITENDDGEAKLVYRKLLTPLVSYSLSSCSVGQEDVLKDGLACFAFRTNKDKVIEDRFIRNIQDCLIYKCLSCNLTMTSTKLKVHLMAVHPLDTIMTCTKCFKKIQIVTLLRTRWRHDCKSN